MDIGAFIIGDELLSGKRQDKHLPKLIELLAARGLKLAWAQYLGDNPARLLAALRHSLASGDLVFSFGGIGATPDDHTRACAAAALYFLLADVADRFHLLKYGLAAVLTFIGMKMLLLDVFHMPVAVSLGVVFGLLTASIVASLLVTRKS